MDREASQDIHRVRRDLAAIQDALGTGYPFGRADVVGWLGIAGVSGLGAIAAWTRSAAVSGVTGVLGLTLVAAVVIWTLRTWRRRAATPVAWREVRTVTKAKLLGGPVVLAFIAWQLHLGVSVTHLVSFTTFFGGIVVMIYATTRAWRRVGFGLAVPLVAFGALVPVMPPERVVIGSACTGVVAGLSCAAIIAVQMRSLRAPAAL
jgi:hypothetical protein